MNKFPNNAMYVLGIQRSGVVNNTQKDGLEELAGELMKQLVPGFKGEIPINWEVPEKMKRSGFSKVIPKEKRREFVDALPDGVSVNLE